MLELDLAELARTKGDHPEAVRLYGVALHQLPGGALARRGVATRGRANSLYNLGRNVEATADFLEARRLAQVQGDAELEIAVLLDHATGLDWANDAPGSRRLSLEAEAVARGSGTTSLGIRAALAVAHGRTAFREGKWARARTLLEEAVALSGHQGIAGYGSLVVALLLLAVVLPNLGAIDEAAAVSERVIALTKAHGDRLNLASALNNRRNVLVARGDVQAAIADQKEFMEIGREIGLALSAYYGEYNQAELLYQAGDVKTANEHAARAAALESGSPEMASRPVASLLRARLMAFEGLVEESRKLLGEIEESIGRSRSDGRASGALLPSEEVLASMVDLATREASEKEWDALVARSERESVEQESIEVLEMRALSAQRAGKTAEAKRCFELALELSTRIPNVMQQRLQKGRDTARN